MFGQIRKIRQGPSTTGVVTQIPDYYNIPSCSIPVLENLSDLLQKMPSPRIDSNLKKMTVEKQLSGIDKKINKNAPIDGNELTLAIFLMVKTLFYETKNSKEPAHQDKEKISKNKNNKQKQQNPWNIESIYDLQYFNCPSCVFQNHSKQTFVDHIYEYHSEAINDLNKIEDDSLDDVICPWVASVKIEVSGEEPLNDPLDDKANDDDFDYSTEQYEDEAFISEATEDSNENNHSFR